MALLRIDPITRKRLQRFRRIKRGYYSFVILTAAVLISLFSNFLANRRALIVSYEGRIYLPTYRFHEMATFGQSDEYGFEDVEADYRTLKKEFSELRAEFAARMESFDGTEKELLAAEPRLRRKDNWVLMPPVPYDPYENDFDYADPPPR